MDVDLMLSEGEQKTHQIIMSIGEQSALAIASSIRDYYESDIKPLVA